MAPDDTAAARAQTTRLRDLRRQLEDDVVPLATSIDGRTFGFTAPVRLALQPGGYVRLETGDGAVLGQVLEHALVREEGPELDGLGAGGERLRSRIVYQGAAGSGTVLEPVEPFHDAEVVPAEPTEVAAWLEHGRPARARLAVGEALFAEGVPVSLDAGGFDRHTFHCGQSGAGKSYALSVVLEQLLLETDLRIIVLDPNSDCVRLRETRPDAGPETSARWAELVPRIAVRSLGAEGDDRLRLRYFDLDAATQAAVAGLDPLRDREEYGALVDLVEDEARGVSLDELRAALGGAGAHGTPELLRLGLRIRNLRILEWPIWSGSRDDGGVLDELDRDDWRCLVVDLGSVPSAAERSLVATAIFARLWERRTERRPVLVVVDEAHNVCPQAPADTLTAAATEHAVRIAAEGRKFGLYLYVSTQRPQKVHENVLSQCDNLVLMRMNSTADVAHLAGLFSYAPPSLLGRSTVLRQGEALVAGKILPHPAFLKFGARVAREGGADVPATWAAARTS